MEQTHFPSMYTPDMLKSKEVHGKLDISRIRFTVEFWMLLLAHLVQIRIWGFSRAISLCQQSGGANIDLTTNAVNFFDFGHKNIASEAGLYLVTEPGLLDDFIRDFSHLDEEIGTERQLECIDL